MKKVWLVVVMCLFPVMSFAASADLAWEANTESDLAGYNIYRGNGACPVGPLQPLMVGGVQASVSAPSTGYTDSTVPVFDGELCYELTAFDTSGNESLRSVRATTMVNLVPPVAPMGMTIGAVRQ